MSFKFKPIPTIDREATEQELENIKESEKMLKGEKKLPPMSQMVRNIAVDHWKSLKAFMRGKHVIVPQEIAQKRWEECIKCDKINPDTDKKDGRCTECGCFMNVKTHYATAECPIKKWKKFEKK